MPLPKRLLLFSFALLLALPIAVPAQQIQTPSQFLGFEVGADRTLADYHQIAAYFQYLASKSPRIRLESMGKTTNGNDFILAAISTEDNLKGVARYQEIARQLARPRGLSARQIAALVHEGKAIVVVSCNIHSNEIASSQMAMEWAHALITAQDPETLRRLGNVILLLVPSLNPDGEIMETEWYRQQLGTPYEGGAMPWLYNRYTGHDDNRDWYMLTQKETREMTRAAYKEWFPQVWLDEHQMGSNGPRLFVPPYADPIAPSVSPLMWRGINLIGSTMAWRLEQAGKAGVVSHYDFDAYYPGSVDSNPEFKNVFGLITEAASARLATPMDLDPSELSPGGKGLADYTVASNFPHPWPGGTWRLRDIMDYERIASDALLETVSNGKADFMRGAVAMAQQQIAAGKPHEYWRIPRQQRDPVAAARLAHLMDENGAEVLVTPQAFLIPTAQAYGKYVQELLGTQRYPEARDVANGPILRPYDITAWSLPLMMGVEVAKGVVPAAATARALPITASDWPSGRVEGSGAVVALTRASNSAYRLLNAALKAGAAVSVAQAAFQSGAESYPPGTLLLENAPGLAQLASSEHLAVAALPQKPAVPLASLHAVRVGLYQPWTASMDEGWTRFVLDQYGFAPKTIHNDTMRAGNLKASFDAIILPDVSEASIIGGQPGPRSNLPPPYSGGIGREGVQALRDFVEAGGTLITLAASGDLAANQLGLPVRNVLARVPAGEFSCPGSILRVHLNPEDPVNYGMPEDAAIFLSEAIAYQTAPPPPGMQRSVIARYPSAREDVLLSGWMTGADLITRRAAAVSVGFGKGKVVMFGFRVQNRAQTAGTFKMLFNAIEGAALN